MIATLSALALVATTYQVHVVSCYDGDTCTVDIQLEDMTTDLGMGLVRTTRTVWRHQTVRLCGIDAPELPSEAGRQARDALLAMVRAAHEVQLRLTAKRDKYGRLLGYLLADGIDLGRLLRQKSLAAPYTSCPGGDP